ncbi:hypothetical protein LCGC14_3146090, partial [marine sediment metagenome]
GLDVSDISGDGALIRILERIEEHDGKAEAQIQEEGGSSPEAVESGVAQDTKG